MTVLELLQNEHFTTLTGEVGLLNPITGVYAGDLLSWVMGKAKEGDAWITIQGHLNVVAVATLVGVGCMIAAEDAPVEPETITKAITQDVPILATSLTTYETCKLLAELGGW